MCQVPPENERNALWLNEQPPDTRRVRTCAMKMGDLADQASAPASVSAKDSATPALWRDLKWLLLDSKLLDGEHVLVVFEKRWLTEARRAHPGTVIYFPPEIEELKRVKDAPDTIKFLHRIKKEFGAWIVPSNLERAWR